MIDRTSASYELSRNESVALDWLDSHDYNGKIVSQAVTNTVINISKGDISGEIKIPTLGTLVVSDLIKRLTKSISELAGKDDD